MANANPSRVGQNNGQGDVLANFLKVFSGEVLATFNRQAYFRDKQLRRTISSGKSAQFPTVGIAQAYDHTPGDEILGQKILSSERVIDIEGLKIAPIFVASIDDFMTHWDYRSPYVTDIAQALSKLYDQNVFREIVNAARTTTPNVLGVFPNDTLTSTLTAAGYANDGAVLFQGFYDANVLLDQRDVPMDGRFITVDPVGYSLLIKSEKPFDYRLNDGRQGLGGYAEGAVRMIAGVPVGKTNNLVKTNNIGDTSQPANRRNDYSVTQGILHHNSAVGTVAMQDVTMETGWDMRRQGWLMLGKYLCGHGKLRPEAAVELRSAAPAT